MTNHGWDELEKIFGQGLIMNMDLDLLERSPEVMPLLVRLHDMQRADKLPRCERKETYSELSNVMLDLLQVNLEPGEKELITDVLIGLMRQAEIDLRKALADRLSVMEDIPLRMVLHLANDEPIVADNILRESPILQEMDLIYIVKSHGPGHWQSIARRQYIGGQLVDVLAETKDLETAITLSENETAELTENAVEIFADMAKHSEALAKPLLVRKELPKGMAKKLYAVVGHELKKSLEKEYGFTGNYISEEIADLVLEFEEADTRNFMPSVRQITNAEAMKSHGSLDIDSMMRVLRRGQIASFIAQFSVHSGMSAQTVHDILAQEKGQGLAIACKALGISKPDFMSFFLLSNKIRYPGDGIVDQAELGSALGYYDRVEYARAQKILQASQEDAIK